ISSDTIIVGLLSPNRKLFSDNNLQFYEKESTSVQITQILRKLKPAPFTIYYFAASAGGLGPSGGTQIVNSK
ncbi:MAG TPA: hypothetical protein VLI39_17355, partial [Sedimentisphaerales bacterium]|nr:hypothetical protein [Sedimentisphaerales bacterium]